ncbi:hypothetical protein P8C59_008004 [Phyllachora maydis]|uniref:Uncharacterized protein n=1 Tax=Phyllachora maydis TaxID=1825666 RepID=A0AAD9IAA0_9PEZI|nr:hypothetical protein P8C59_008004 [Phyllachora maydis]
MHPSPAPSACETPPSKAEGEAPPHMSECAAHATAEDAGLPGPSGTHLHPGSSPTSPPVRKDTDSSMATAATMATLASLATEHSVAVAVATVDSSPTYHHHHPPAVFSVKDGGDVNKGGARGTRRRTGPLSALQRERAALIRKLGACPDCRRRRVACHPNHHNMTWEDAAAKYRSHSPNSMQDMSPLAGRPLSPAAHYSATKSLFAHEPDDMDSTPTHPHPHPQPIRPAATAAAAAAAAAPISDPRIRTPLPSAPRLEKTGSAASASGLPCFDSVKTDLLQSTASRIVASQHRSPYTAADVLALHWAEDEDVGVRPAIDELATVLGQQYHYAFETRSIPSSTDGCRNSSRWLSRAITEFIDRRDQRDVLKVVYYNGHTFLDANREMVLASPKTADAAFAIRWSGIQQILETASSDTLIIMDAAYYASSKLVRQQGVLELMAARAGDDAAHVLERNLFTRALAHELHARANQRFASPLSAAELHAKLLTLYPSMVPDRSPAQQVVVSFPSPLHIQLSGKARLPSILLAPVPQGAGAGAYGLESPPSAGSSGAGATLGFTFRLADESINVDSWIDWLRMMPEGIREVKVDGFYRNTFR